MDAADRVFQKISQETQNYFSVSEFEKKPAGQEGKFTYIHGENAAKLFKYLSFPVILTPLTMGLGLVASEAYLSLRGRLSSPEEILPLDKRMDSARESAPNFPHAEGLQDDGHNADIKKQWIQDNARYFPDLESFEIDTNPTSSHAGAVLVLPYNQVLSQSKDPSNTARLQFVRKNENKGNKSWTTIGAKNETYRDTDFKPVELGAFRAIQGSRGESYIKIGESNYRLPGNLDEGKTLWKACESLKTALDGETKGINFEIDTSLTPPELSKPEPNAAFIQDKNLMFKETSTQNDLEVTTYLQAKNTLSEGEHCADYATTESRGNVTLAIVADAAGNKESSNHGSTKLVNLFRENFWAQLNNKENEGIADALKQSLILTAIETKADLNPVGSTMACTAVLKDEKGDRYAVGFCIGDARAMLKRKDGSSIDLAPTSFSSPYSIQGSHFGGGIKEIQPIFQKLEEGDVLLLGSDGFGDNMEAKSLGVSPLKALAVLDQAGKLENNKALKELANNQEPWILPAGSTSFWTYESMKVQTPEANKVRAWQQTLDDNQKGLLQELHELYSLHVLDGMKNDNLAEQVHLHCTQSLLVKTGIFLADINKEIDKGEDSNSLFKDHLQEYKDYAGQLYTFSPKEQQELFAEWDADPSKAHDWMTYKAGKPDDFSLISLSITS